MAGLERWMVVFLCCLLCTSSTGDLSTYSWDDDSGTVHTINQGEGGEQGDPLMPLLFAVGQHPVLVAGKIGTERMDLRFPRRHPHLDQA